MKLSKYNYEVKLSEDKNLIYNTFTRKYYVYDSSYEDGLKNLLRSINKEKFTLQEADIIKELAQKGIVTEDNFDELEVIKFNEKMGTFQGEVFNLTIQPTLDCNFRCVYCYEKHTKKVMDDMVAEKLVGFVKIISKKVRKLNVMWFGGEPLLELQRIVYLTEKFKEICNESNCIYSALMVSNGYLLNDEVISMLKNLSITRIQITLDGYGESHDRQRPLENGEGSFEKVRKNVLKILDAGIDLTFRINVSDENYKEISQVFDIIPADKRKRVVLSMCNLFNNKGKISTYELYMESIKRGYPYYNVYNKITNCDQCTKNSITVEPDGTIVPCSYAAEDGCKLGNLNSTGSIILDNRNLYYRLKNISVFDNEKCKECISLPICMGGCKYARYKDKEYCNGLRPDGLTLSEKIKLHYYSDVIFNHKEL